MFQNISIKQKLRKELTKLYNYNIKKDIVAKVVDGKTEATVKLLNPDQQAENTELVEARVMSIFYPDVKDFDELEVEEYETKKKALMDFLTENKEKYDWLIKFNLCKEHELMNKEEAEKQEAKKK